MDIQRGSVLLTGDSEHATIHVYIYLFPIPVGNHAIVYIVNGWAL